MLGENIVMVGEVEGLINHDEADIIMVSYLLQVVHEGKIVIHILSDDKGISILLLHSPGNLGE